MVYGICETYGKASLMQRCKQVFKKRKSEFVELPVINNLNKYDQHEEEC